MIIDSGVYRDGCRREVPISLAATAQALQEDPEVFAWVDLYEPEPIEMASVRDLFGFHELAIEDAGAPHQRPKIERYDDSLFVVLRTLWYVDDENAVETGQVSVFIGDRIVVTVWHGARDQLFAARDPGRLPAQGRNRSAPPQHGPRGCGRSGCVYRRLCSPPASRSLPGAS